MAKLSMCVAYRHCTYIFVVWSLMECRNKFTLFNFILHIPLQLSHRQESSVYKEHVTVTREGANNTMNLSSMTQLNFVTITRITMVDIK